MNVNFMTLASLETVNKAINKVIKEDLIRNMTCEEAVQELETHANTLRDMIIFNQDFSPENDNYSLKKQVRANSLAIEALNKATPQKVIVTYDYLGFEKCPRCKYGNLLTRDYVQFEYCPMCGQKLEWE